MSTLTSSSVTDTNDSELRTESSLLNYLTIFSAFSALDYFLLLNIIYPKYTRQLKQIIIPQVILKISSFEIIGALFVTRVPARASFRT